MKSSLPFIGHRRVFRRGNGALTTRQSRQRIDGTLALEKADWYHKCVEKSP